MNLHFFRPEKVIVYENDTVVAEDISFLEENIRAVTITDSGLSILEYEDKDENDSVPQEYIDKLLSEFEYVSKKNSYSKEYKIYKRDGSIELDYDSKWNHLLWLRDSYLHQTDWTQMPDNPISDEKKEQYKLYRQELRDFTTRYTKDDAFVENILPISPEDQS